MSAIAECFDHILTDHATKGHATLIGAAMREIDDMKKELTRLKRIEPVARKVTQIGLGYDGQEYALIMRQGVKELALSLARKE